MKVKDKLVILSYFIYTFINLIVNGNTLESIRSINMITNFFKMIIILFLFAIVLMERRSLKDWILLVGTLLLSLVAFINSGVNTFLFVFLFLFASSNISYFHFVKLDTVFRILLVMFVAFLNRLGILSDIVLVRTNGGVRHSLGFSHPNTLGILFCMIGLNLIIIFWHYKTHGLMLAVLALSIINNLITDSRTSVIIMMLAIVLIPIFKFLDQKKYFTKIRGLLIGLPIFLCGLSYLIVARITAQNPLFSVINSMTSSRLYYYKNVYSNYGLSLFGQNIPVLSESYVKQYFLKQQFLDSTYLSLIIRYGIFLFFIFSYYVGRLISNIIKQNNIQVLLVIILFLLLGITENNVFKPELCSLCMMGCFLNQKMKDGNEGEI
ncbi:hypothetical protein HQ956_09875 [Enterococcus faecium]|nr:hypothetical protein [Enterococcus faecium]